MLSCELFGFCITNEAVKKKIKDNRSTQIQKIPKV